MALATAGEVASEVLERSDQKVLAKESQEESRYGVPLTNRSSGRASIRHGAFAGGGAAFSLPLRLVGYGASW